MRLKWMIPAATFAVALIWPLAALAGSGSTGGTQTALTIYNQGPAVVWQTRELSLSQGQQTIGWPGTSPSLVAESLWLASDGVSLVSATVPGAQASPSAMLARRIGQTVTLISTESDRTRQATLVSVAGNTVVVRAGDQLVKIDAYSNWHFAWPAPAYPTGLKLTVDAGTGGEQPVTLAYQRSGVTWHASYTGRFDAQAGTLRLQSLAVIKNTSNAPVTADQVALVAGDVARTSSAPRPRVYMKAAAMGRESSAEPERAGSYYRYTLGQPVDLRPGATQVLALMPAQTLEVERNYVVEGAWYRGASGQRSHATIKLKLENTTGKPLPAGPVRVYGEGQAMLLGEDRIGNVPEGAPVTLVLGEAFDVTAERRITQSNERGDVRKQTVEVTVYNAREEAVTVTLIEHLPDDAEIISASAQHGSRTANQVVWHLQVSAQGKTVLTYSYRWSE